MKFHAHLRAALVIAIVGTLTLAACGGSTSSSGTSRKRNASLADVNLRVDDAIEQMAPGAFNNVVLTHAGEVISWGRFGDAPTDTARLIASSSENAVAITLDNKYKIWGSKTEILDAGAPGIDFSNVTQVGITDWYGLALTKDGKLQDWGDNKFTGPIPAELSSLTIKKFDVSRFGVLAIDSDNKLHAWNGTEMNFPSSWNGMSVKSIASGGGWFVVVDMNGKLHRWNIWGADDKITAEILAGTYSQVSAAKNGGFWIAVDTTGKMVIWGWVLSTGLDISIPEWINNDPSNGDEIVSVSIGYDSVFVQHSWGLESWSYGRDTNYELPYSLNRHSYLNPIAAGGSHTYVINDAYGIEQIDDSQSSTILPEGNDFIAIAAGLNHGLALHRNGTLAGWSDSQYDGTDFDARTAARIPSGLKDVTNIAAGFNWSLAVSNRTNLHEWGTIYSPSQTTTNFPEGQYDFIQLKATYNHAVALVTDLQENTMKVIAWGDNSAKQTEVPASVVTAAAAKEITDVAAGYNCSAALHTNGTITVWGTCSGYKSLLNAPAVPGAWRIELGTDFGIAVGGDTKTITTWGENTSDYATVPDEAANTSYVAVGRFHIVTADWNGNVVAWGSNSQNQTNIPSSLKFINLEIGYGGQPMSDEEWQQELDRAAAEANAQSGGIVGGDSASMTIPSTTAPAGGIVGSPASSITLKDGTEVTVPAPPEAPPAPEPVSAKSTVQVVVAPDPSVVRVGAVVSTGTAAKIMGVKKATNIRFGKVDAGSSKNCVKVASGIKAKKSGSCVVNVTYTYKKKTIGAKINIVVTP